MRKTLIKRPGRLGRLATGLLAAGLALSACSSSSKPTAMNDVPGADALAAAAGVTEVTFWHGMTGTNGKAVDALVADFDAAHAGKIHVTATYTGNYDDTLAKYKTAVTQKQTPSIVQIYDVGTRFMVDSKQAIPMQSFADKDGYSVTDLQPNIANYYTVSGRLQSMPFNASMPLLYINADAFRAAGLDPAKPPTTLDELAADAKLLTNKDKSGKTIRYGFGAAIYGWFVEQFAAESGSLYCDNGNGRAAAATKLDITSGAPLTVTKWWADLVRGGYAANTGRTTADAQAAFKAGTVAMNIESTGVLGAYVAAAKGEFTVATAPFPKVAAGDTGGPVIGGASLWIDAVGHSAAEERASWEFAKFASSPAEQAKWHIATGYFPVSTKALSDPSDVAYRTGHPQFQTAVDELTTTTPSQVTAGCLLGVMPAARADLELGIQNAITGSATPQDALNTASDQIKKLVSDYNKAVAG